MSDSSWTTLLTYTLAFAPVLFLLHLRLTRLRVYPRGLPWVGLHNQRFAEIRAHYRELSESKQNISEGYQKYGMFGIPFVTPNFTWKPEVVLPPQHAKWLIEQPDDVLSIREVLIEDVQFNYTSPRAWKFSRPFHIEALNKMRLDLMTPSIIDEIDLCLKDLFGNESGKWNSVEVLPALQQTLCKITNRVFVGKELAHNQDYLVYSTFFINSILGFAKIIEMFIPALLKPILGPIVVLPCRYFEWRCSRHLVPLIEKHLAAAKKEKDAIWSERNPDMLQLMSRFAVKSDDSIDHDPRSLCSRLLALNFVGIHTSSAAAINAFIDICSASPNVFFMLRKEAAIVLRKSGGSWTKKAVDQLVYLDSTLRESLRFSAFKARGVERQVVKKDGVVLPDGAHLPHGTKIGLPTTEIHYDDCFYVEPEEFRYDRFVGTAERGMVNTEATFLAFGLGKHACPGRFFSTHELKLLFAYIVLNYDVEFLPWRPRMRWVSDFCMHNDVRIRVQRREKSAHLEPEDW